MKVGVSLEYQTVGWSSILRLVMGSRKQADEREGAELSRRCASAHALSPLALRLDAQVGPHVVEGDFHLPAHHTTAVRRSETLRRHNTWRHADTEQLAAYRTGVW